MSNLKMTSLAVAAALAGAVSMVGLTASTAALAADDKVKCFGIAKAGENDCANAAGTHSCAGHSAADYFGGDWKLAKSADFCLTEGGMLKPFDGTNEMHG